MWIFSFFCCCCCMATTKITIRCFVESFHLSQTILFRWPRSAERNSVGTARRGTVTPERQVKLLPAGLFGSCRGSAAWPAQLHKLSTTTTSCCQSDWKKGGIVDERGSGGSCSSSVPVKETLAWRKKNFFVWNEIWSERKVAREIQKIKLKEFFFENPFFEKKPTVKKVVEVVVGCSQRVQLFHVWLILYSVWSHFFDRCKCFPDYD